MRNRVGPSTCSLIAHGFTSLFSEEKQKYWRWSPTSLPMNPLFTGLIHPSPLLSSSFPFGTGCHCFLNPIRHQPLIFSLQNLQLLPLSWIIFIGKNKNKKTINAISPQEYNNNPSLIHPSHNSWSIYQSSFAAKLLEKVWFWTAASSPEFSLKFVLLKSKFSSHLSMKWFLPKCSWPLDCKSSVDISQSSYWTSQQWYFLFLEKLFFAF